METSALEATNVEKAFHELVLTTYSQLGLHASDPTPQPEVKPDENMGQVKTKTIILPNPDINKPVSHSTCCIK